MARHQTVLGQTSVVILFQTVEQLVMYGLVRVGPVAVAARL